MIIEKFNSDLYPTIVSWYGAYEQKAPDIQMIPETTFIAKDPEFCMTVSLILTNASVVWVEHFIKDPTYRGEARAALFDFIKRFSRENGYDRMFCIGETEGIKRLYHQMGFEKQAEMATFTLPLKEEVWDQLHQA